MTDINDAMGAGLAASPPHSIEAEVCVLGSMILDATTIDLVVQIAGADLFFRPAHQVLFRILVEMHDAGTPIDLVLLRNELIRRGTLEKVGGLEYLTALVESVPSTTVSGGVKM